MRQETFESKIRGKLEAFERQAPAKSWERIQQEIQPPLPTTAGSIFTSKIVLGAIGGILLSVIGFQFSKTLEKNKEIENISVFTHYWEALEVAQQENKPLLVLFTMNCTGCDSLKQELLEPEVAELANQYIQVQLPIDDETAIDSNFIARIPAQFRQEVNIRFQNDSITLQLKTDNTKLRTVGEVWLYLQARYIYIPQPTLAIFDHQGGQIEFNLPEQRGDINMKQFLALHLDIFEQGFLQTKSMYVAQCASCHSLNMKDVLTGPALGGVGTRWKEYPKEDLYNFVRNSQQMIADGHPKAVEHWKEWRPVVMPNFSNLSNQELEQLLDFVEWRYAKN